MLTNDEGRNWESVNRGRRSCDFTCYVVFDCMLIGGLAIILILVHLLSQG